MKRFVILFVLYALPLFCQSNSGELHLKVTDPSGVGVKAMVRITSEANQYRNALSTSEQGTLVVQRLPYGIYRVTVEQPGFAAVSESVEIRSSLPTQCEMQLKLPVVSQSVTVSAANTLIDPDQAGSVSHIDPKSAQLDSRPFHAGPGKFPAGLALRGECGPASARLGVSDPIRGGWHPLDGQSLSQLRT
jgi:hypothetical protein